MNIENKIMEEIQNLDFPSKELENLILDVSLDIQIPDFFLLQIFQKPIFVQKLKELFDLRIEKLWNN